MLAIWSHRMIEADSSSSGGGVVSVDGSLTSMPERHGGNSATEHSERCRAHEVAAQVVASN